MRGLVLKTYRNVYTDKGRVLDTAIMDQYGRIFETRVNEVGAQRDGKRNKIKTEHYPTGECGSANH